MNGIRTNGSRITPLAVASGAIASFDAQVAAPLKILKADIIAVQAGSGDPSPSNIRPISGWDEIKITNESGEIFEAANIVASESEIAAYYDADLVLKPGTYIFSTDATDSVTLIGAQYYSGSWHNIFTQAIGTSRRFTLSRSGKCHFRVELRVSGDLSSNTVSLKQLDERTIELPDTVYGGKLDALKGVVSEEYKFKIFDGSENWQDYSAFDGYYCYVDSMKQGMRQDGMCDKLKVSKSTQKIANTMWLGVNTKYFYVIGVKDSMGADVTAFKNYLSNNPLQLVYPLVTPTSLTADPISMDSYAGSNKISADSGNTTACYLKGVTT